jgi:hypothetical protein
MIMQNDGNSGPYSCIDEDEEADDSDSGPREEADLRWKTGSKVYKAAWTGKHGFQDDSGTT